MFIIELAQKLKKDKVEFAIAGGFAVVLHGFVRGTVDIDLVLAIDLENLKSIEKSLGELGLKSRIPVNSEEIFKFRKEYIEKRNLIAWSFVDYKDPSKVVDIILTHDLKRMRKVQITAYGEKLPVLSKEDLIKMKLAAGRPQDLEDIKALKER